jgi:RNA polymerase sigma-70 factor (ECF subfamily)
MASGARLGDRDTRLGEIVADRNAFRTWYDEVLPPVYRYLLTRCGHDTALAEELTQQTFVDAVRHLDRFDGRSSVVTWLCAIGRHKLADHYRRADRRRRRDLRLRVSQRADGLEVWAEHERRSEVAEALAQLPGPQQLVLVLRYLDDLPVREVAQTIGRSEKATESLLSRAREAFRRVYGAPQP